VWAYQGKVYFIIANGAFDGSSGSCPWAANSMMYAADPTTPWGRSLISIALTAKLTARLVYIGGDGACAPAPGGNAEGIVHMDFKG
jgi:hypothetical protein